MIMEELFDWEVPALDGTLKKNIEDIWDKIAIPLDSLGKMQHIITQIGCIQNTEHVSIDKKVILTFCGDNGVVEEGVTQTGREVTTIVAENMGRQESSVCRMAKHIGAKVIPVDVGICTDKKIDGVLSKKVCKGTKNFMKEPALSKEETLQAMMIGMELVKECKEQGYELLGIGEMGIGNTTTSSVIASAILALPAARVTGRGAGLNDEGLQKKIKVVEQAVIKYDLKEKDAFTILSYIGGTEIAAMTGACLGAAKYQMPIVLDGVISQVAALIAEKIKCGCNKYMISSHGSKEPASLHILDALGLDPVIDGKLALGEGTGAVMMMALLDLAMEIYSGMNAFADLQIDAYERFEK